MVPACKRHLFTIWVCLVLSSAVITTQTTVTTTPESTTVPLPPGACLVDNKIYLNGENITVDSGGCGGTMCLDGSVAYWDAWCMFFSSSPPTTTPLQTTPPPPTTTPKGPPGGCFYENKWYYNGQSISTDRDNCYGIICEGGETLHWDHECFFNPDPPCDGWSEKVPGQCCPVCHTTTPPPTTMPFLPHGSCELDGFIYHDGMIIETSPDYCHGWVCDSGRILTWDHECFLSTPCDGWSEKVPGQCCPECHPWSTTTPTPTTPAPPDCLHNGQIYRNYDIFDTDENGCYGFECHYGIVRPWRKHCSMSESDCDGTLVNVTGQCCPLCQVFSNDNTTLSSSESTSTSSSTLNGTTQAPTGCTIRGEFFALNERTNRDVCNICHCTLNGEKCQKTVCGDVSDCALTYRPMGECCFMCGATQSLHKTFGLFFLPILVTLILLTTAQTI